MEADLLGAEASAHALHQRENRGRNQQPVHEAHEQTGSEADVERTGSNRLPTDPVSLSILVVAQLLWIALLAYATYALWQRLPF